MRFVETLLDLQAKSDSVSGNLDGTHSLKVEALRPNIIRVFVKKGGDARLGRTWTVAQGASTVPLGGIPRESLPGERAPFDFSEDRLQVGEIELRFHRDPYFLEWLYRGKTILKERTTGSVAFGRRDNRIWHFHQLQESSRFYGLGERTGELDRRGRSFELRNVDPMGYDARTSDPLYKHIPFYIDHNQNGYAGIFYDNLSNARLNFGEEIDNYHGPFTSYRAEDGDLDYYVICCPTLLEVTQAFSWLTGRTYLPPKWSLGYSTTSMTYTDVDNAQERVTRFLQDAKEHDIALKSFKYGSGYTSKDGKRYVFTWNQEKFPSPKLLNDAFHQRKIRLAANIKPVLLTDHPDYQEVKALFVQDSEDEQQEVSQFWDNRGSHLDFTNPATIDWWKTKVKEQLLDFGIDALWNDNNEYVIWDDEARCHGFGKAIPISLVRPLMSLWMTRASHEIAQAQDPQKRIWSISRCGCPGMQRYAQTWSGDNYTAWETLEYNNKMALGLSLSGIYNIGHDVGGFAGPAPDPELLARWYFIGAFTPRFGVNSWKPDGTITEPWMYPEMLGHIKSALALRMRFLPQLYSLLWESYDRFSPLLRPTFANFPDDSECWNHTTEFMWGSSLLVAPVLLPNQRQRKVYLPVTPHGWWDVHNLTHYPGGMMVEIDAALDSIPLFAKGGSALFLAEWGADSIDGPEHTREIHIFPGGQFSDTFYDDDGETHAHTEGEFLKVQIEVATVGGQVEIEVKLDGDYRPEYTELRFMLPPGFESNLDALLLEDE